MDIIARAIARIFDRVMSRVGKLSGPGTKDLVIDHELEGVTPEMVHWWWLNMSDTRRYRLWHPRDHISAVWEVPPGEKGADPIQLALEKIGGLPMLARIRFGDPAKSPVETTYSHVVTGAVLDRDGETAAWVVHEYEPMPGGTRMRSTFRLPAKTPGFYVRAVRKHCEEEMAQLPRFLPGLYTQTDR